ncbi:bacteriorhodopsin [Microcella daejeonensis]|uniref:Bacteriorhodopsin n=1 Tax=Microcella daejeonensis TaxID=2994971 RepID=A0A9E8S9I6_9MICO|nr:bacteriorhodopsin [Microcella daejeonensis]WAB81546.1 bacteriorhodopsin [Microcella daejeonensis]WAB83692.1 bacteriorhodopsin [Microcella daejeonensis]
MDFQIVQAFFMLGFVAMAAGTVWFVLERNDLKPELRSVATYAAVITFVAAILYYVMKDVVQFPGGAITADDVEATAPLRYIDWLITTPLLLIEFVLIVALAGAVKKGLLTKIVIADIIMIVTGYLGEMGEPGSVANVIYFVISSAAWIYIIFVILKINVSGAPDHVQSAVRIMRLFVIIGWAIYPIGTALQEFLEIGGADIAIAASVAACIYVVADVVNKVGFGIIAVNAAKKSSVARQLEPSA